MTFITYVYNKNVKGYECFENVFRIYPESKKTNVRNIYVRNHLIFDGDTKH